MMCEISQEDSVCIEAWYKVFADKLKEALCRIRLESQDECQLEVKEIKNEIDKEFVLDAREEYFEGRELTVSLNEIEEEEMKDDDEDLISRMSDG